MEEWRGERLGGRGPDKMAGLRRGCSGRLCIRGVGGSLHVGPALCCRLDAG